MKKGVRDSREDRLIQEQERLRLLEDTIAHMEAACVAAQLLARVQDSLAAHQLPSSSGSALSIRQLTGPY
jgi:hypothetical protein